MTQDTSDGDRRSPAFFVARLLVVLAPALCVFGTLWSFELAGGRERDTSDGRLSRALDVKEEGLCPEGKMVPIPEDSTYGEVVQQLKEDRYSGEFLSIEQAVRESGRDHILCDGPDYTGAEESLAGFSLTGFAFSAALTLYFLLRSLLRAGFPSHARGGALLAALALVGVALGLFSASFSMLTIDFSPMGSSAPDGGDVFDTATVVYVVSALASICIALALTLTTVVSKIRESSSRGSNQGGQEQEGNGV